MDKEQIKEFKKIFKKAKVITFPIDCDKYNMGVALVWCADKTTFLPGPIFIGQHGAPKPMYKFQYEEIDHLEATKPGLFKKGTLQLIMKDGRTVYIGEYKDKESYKETKIFDETLRLCNELNVAQYREK